MNGPVHNNDGIPYRLPRGTLRVDRESPDLHKDKDARRDLREEQDPWVQDGHG